MLKIPVYKIKIPEYRAKTKPDYFSIGAKIDNLIKKHFLGQNIAIRCIGSQEHEGKTVNALIRIIKKTGTDRYDPNRPGDRYENTKNKHIDIFALDFKITDCKEYLRHFIKIFNAWPKNSGKEPVRLDIVIIYDRAKLRRVLHQYEGLDDIKRDGFVFKEPDNKASAVKGIIKIL